MTKKQLPWDGMTSAGVAAERNIKNVIWRPTTKKEERKLCKI
jgi:hypothetical protein